MADQTESVSEEAAATSEVSSEAASERIPLGQRLFDDVFLLLMLGLLVSLLSYLVWGLWHISVVPVYTP